MATEILNDTEFYDRYIGNKKFFVGEMNGRVEKYVAAFRCDKIFADAESDTSLYLTVNEVV